MAFLCCWYSVTAQKCHPPTSAAHHSPRRTRSLGSIETHTAIAAASPPLHQTQKHTQPSLYICFQHTHTHTHTHTHIQTLNVLNKLELTPRTATIPTSTHCSPSSIHHLPHCRSFKYTHTHTSPRDHNEPPPRRQH